jgi:hypothetical protein
MYWRIDDARDIWADFRKGSDKMLELRHSRQAGLQATALALLALTLSSWLGKPTRQLPFRDNYFTPGLRLFVAFNC